MFFVPLWITFDATSFPSSQTGGFSSFHPQSRLSLVGVNQNYFSWSASTVPTPSSVYSSAGIELTASCFSGGIELYHSTPKEDLMKLFASTLGVPVELFTVPVLSEPREYEAAEYWRYELGAELD